MTGSKMSQNYTDGARRAVVLAQEEARAMMHDSYIGPEHLLLGLLHAYPNTVQTVAGRLAGRSA
jgi:ATP-dependent Clp protease ATP-binding subunit ClpC